MQELRTNERLGHAEKGSEDKVQTVIRVERELWVEFLQLLMRRFAKTRIVGREISVAIEDYIAKYGEGGE